jgi:predicted metal-dependent peptidase
MTCENRLKAIIKNWFITEPLLFSVVTTHHLVLNEGLSVPMRSGRLCIEFSDLLTSELSDAQLTDFLKIEAYRILLKHPYARQPYKANPTALQLASDVIISKYFTPPSGIETAGLIYLKSIGLTRYNEDLTFEQWYKKLLKIIRERSAGGGEASGAGALSDYDLSAVTESAELWQEDENAQNQIDDKIKKAEIENGWGETGGNLVRTLQDEADFSFDYRRALTKFRANIVSVNRRLTRMKPSRRYGFAAMGSRYERKADILIAVDVSGSITDESFARFYHAIKNFFFLKIIENIDLVFFDVNLKNTTPVKFTKNLKLAEITGRGGTNFQPPIDYFLENRNHYSGMIIFTDGEGDVPEMTGAIGNSTILWILDSRLAWEKSRWWIEKLPGNSGTFLP